MTALRPKSNAAAVAEAETWRTAREIAERRYPGLPHTERSIRRLAARMGWPKRKRDGSKACEYPVSAPPAETRAAQEDREAAKAAQAFGAGGARSGIRADIGFGVVAGAAAQVLGVLRRRRP